MPTARLTPYRPIQQAKTTDLEPYWWLRTPHGWARIASVEPAYVRRVDGKAIHYTRIRLYGSTWKALVCSADQLWDVL